MKELTEDQARLPEVPARLSFGGNATEGRARVIERSGRWRRASAAKELLWLLTAPVVVLAPPHIPWAILLVLFVAFRATGRLREHRTLLSLHGPCPKCGTDQAYAEVGRMKEPVHAVHCATCRWEIRVETAGASAAT